MTRNQRYSTIDWRLVRNGGGRLVFTPGTRIVSRRLGWTVAAGILMFGLHFFVGRSLDQAPANRVSRHVAAPVERDSTVAETTNNPMHVGRAAYWAVFGTLMFIGLYGPLSTLWQQVAIARDARGNLVVERRDIIPRRHTWPRGSFEHIAVRAEQLARNQGHGRYRPAGWRWQVALVPPGNIDTQVVFWVGHDGERIDSDTSVPEKVAEFVQALEGLTGLPVREPAFVAFEDESHGRFKAGVRFSRHGVSPGHTVHAETTFGSLDEIPSHLRPQAEALMAQARAKAAGRHWATGSYTATTYRVTGEDGVTRTYASLDEMPPEMRARMEQAQRNRSKPI